MSDLVISKMTETGNQIRSINIPGQSAWYVAKDITNILGYSESGSSQTVKINCENYVRFCDISNTIPSIELNRINELGIGQTTLLIQRPDVHRLIVAAKRTKEEAAQFEKWIFEEVLEEVMDTGTYNLPNASNSQNIDNVQNSKLMDAILNQNNNLNRQNDRLMALMETTNTQHSETIKTISEQNSKMIDCISNFNSVLELTKYQTSISTAFALSDAIEFDRYVDIIRNLTVLHIRANFNSNNLRVYLYKEVGEHERIFKSTGEPYEPYIKNGYYRIEKAETTKVFITKAGSEHLYWFLKAKKILN